MNDGGAKYPTPIHIQTHPGEFASVEAHSSGQTRWQSLAESAMRDFGPLLASEFAKHVERVLDGKAEQTSTPLSKLIAKFAYIVADAMLAEEKRREQADRPVTHPNALGDSRYDTTPAAGV